MSGGGIICKPLDSLNLKDDIAIMKIDVEGMEHKVLEGASELIAKNRPLIYAENRYLSDFSRVERILEKMGYVYWDAFGSRSGAPMHLFIPLESVNERQILAKNSADLKKVAFDIGLNYCENIINRLRLSKRLQIIEICLLVCIVGLMVLLLLK